MSQQDDIKAFNQYCERVMGYPEDFKIVKPHSRPLEYLKYNPYSNLNQLAEVFDKLWHQRIDEEISKSVAINSNFRVDIFHKGIATAMREFIWSTHD